MNTLPENLDDLNADNLTPELIEELRLYAISQRRAPLDTLKWLSEQYTKMYELITNAPEGSQPNYQLVANFLQDAPEWNYELVTHFTNLATLQCEL